MARLAAAELGADWVLNTDADEFWWPRGGSLQDVLAAVPARFGVVRGAWRNFVPRPDDDRFFAERMTVAALRTVLPPASAEHALQVRTPSALRACASAEGTTRRSGRASCALRGWYPIEILHFPVRSLEHCLRKYVTQFVALERNAEKGIPGHMAEAYRAYRAGGLDDFYAPLVVDDALSNAGVADGESCWTRGFVIASAHSASGARDRPTPEPFERPDVVTAAAFAGEYSRAPRGRRRAGARGSRRRPGARVGALERGGSAACGRRSRAR